MWIPRWAEATSSWNSSWNSCCLLLAQEAPVSVLAVPLFRADGGCAGLPARQTSSPPVLQQKSRQCFPPYHQVTFTAAAPTRGRSSLGPCRKRLPRVWSDATSCLLWGWELCSLFSVLKRGPGSPRGHPPLPVCHRGSCPPRRPRLNPCSRVVWKRGWRGGTSVGTAGAVGAPVPSGQQLLSTAPLPSPPDTATPQAFAAPPGHREAALAEL